MKYYARFSQIKEGYGLMGVKDAEFDADNLDELKQQIEGFYADNDTKTTTYLLDELEDENGEEIKL